ncbi:MAG: hypothetical protein KGH64_02490 [Candidatus Micrarchaeota archaeon]|nr:hypothetical protein [Candidatus Micrarchaeota archaeon]MDE1834183.1 hypothetical protein [Candidatus Micrarchaeota archaeon]MDE1859155.1 hypothetical protein [Candidatus Micrarchaeota archaeon]
MPKDKKPGLISFRFVLFTYILGLYGGIVSGILVSILYQKPTSSTLWAIGIGLALLGLILLFVIDKLLRKGRPLI